MIITFFEDTDTAMIELGKGAVAETKELTEDIYVDLDASGHVVSITVEHASERSDMSEIRFKRMTNELVGAKV